MNNFKTRQDAIKTIAEAKKFLDDLENKTPEEFGNNVGEARGKINLSQKELAMAVGLHRGSIANIEAGRQWPTLPKFIRLCVLLKTTPNELLGWNE